MRRSQTARQPTCKRVISRPSRSSAAARRLAACRWRRP
jgi:hypothetical protein